MTPKLDLPQSGWFMCHMPWVRGGMNPKMMRKVKKNRFYFYWAIGFVVAVVVAFAPKYWVPLLRGNFDITTVVHWHAFFTTVWVLIYFVQTLLIRSRSIKLHQNIGFLSAAFTLGVIVSGVYVSIGLVERALLSNSAGAKPLLLVNLLDLLMFGILYGAALKRRKVAVEHKRLMTLACIVLLNPAFFRIGRFFIGPGFAAVLLAVVLTSGVIVLFVWLEKKHSQAANKNLWRIALGIILIHILRIPLAITPAWAAITDFILDVF